METYAVAPPMTPLQSVFQVASVVLFIYNLLLALRIILTWFRGTNFGKPWDYLCRITDPYLNLFRGVRFLRMGMFDFTPLAAILVLVIAQNIFSQLSVQALSFSNVLGVILLAVWRSISWIGIFFAILCGIRTVVLFIGRNQTSPIWQTIDVMLQPVTSKVSRILRRDIEYVRALLITLAALIVFLLLGSLIIGRVVDLLFEGSF